MSPSLRVFHTKTQTVASQALIVVGSRALRHWQLKRKLQTQIEQSASQHDTLCRGQLDDALMLALGASLTGRKQQVNGIADLHLESTGYNLHSDPIPFKGMNRDGPLGVYSGFGSANCYF